MKKILILIATVFNLLLSCQDCLVSALDPFIIDIDYSISEGFLMTRNRVEIFNEKEIAPGDSFRYDILTNNLSEYEIYFYLLRIEELEGSKNLDAFTFSVYEGGNLLFKKNFKEFTKTYLSALSADASKGYVLEVKFEPWANNDYQRAAFHMNIVFGAQDELDEIPTDPEDPEKPVEPPVSPEEPTKPVGPGSAEPPKKKSWPARIPDIINDFLKTGQDFKIYYWLLCLLIISIMIILLITERRKRNGSKNTGNSDGEKEKKR